MPHVKLFVGLARVTFVDGDEAIMTWETCVEASCRKYKDMFEYQMICFL